MEPAEPDPSPPLSRSAELTLRTECGRCGAHLPVNGLHPAVTCSDCERHTEVPAAAWKEPFHAFDHGVDSAGAVTIGDLTWRWSVKASDPECTCGAAVPHDPPTPYTCACGRGVAVVPHGKKASPRIDGVRRTIGGDSGEPVERAPPEPVVMQCPSCTAALRITSTHQRVTDCAYCGSQVHLPDAIWRSLHPARTVQRWWAIVMGPDRAQREHAKHQSKLQRAEQKRLAEAERLERKQAENAAKYAKREAAQKKQEAARAARQAEDDARDAEDRRRHGLRSGVGLALGWAVVSTCGAVMLSILLVLTYGSFLPIDPYVLAGARTGLLAGGLAVGGLAIGVASVVAAWRARAGLTSYLARALFWSLAGGIPIIGLLVAAFIGARLVLRNAPAEGVRPPTLGGGLLMAVALIGTVGYAQIATAGFFGMTVFDFWVEFLERLPDE